MKKGAPFEWDESCKNTFKSIKKYLSSPPVLVAPIPCKPLVLYIAAQERSPWALSGQEKEEGKERALYYFSRTLLRAKLHYSPIRKLCLALMFTVQKLRHYMQADMVRVIFKADQIKYILSRPVLTGWLEVGCHLTTV